jgi:hypothetical protein
MASSGPAAAAAEEERVIGPLLARANLLRLRGQWDEAAVACTEALRLVPNSPSACSLLGDIYEAQRRLDEALQWYGMAVEFDPTNVADRGKLERTAQTRRRILLREEHEAQLRARRAVVPAGPARDRTSGAQRTLQWFDRLFPPGRWDSAARLILLLCAAMTFILLFAAGFVYLSSRNDGREFGAGGMLDAPLAPGTPPPGAGQNVVVMAPVPAPAPNDAPGAIAGPNPPVPPAGTSSATPPAPPLSPDSSVAPAPPADNDPALLDALRRAFAPGTADGDVQVAAAELDERVPQISLSLLLPASAASGAPSEARARILRAAARAVRVAGERRPQVDRALVRVLFAPPAPNAGPAFAFSGETATTAVRAAARGDAAPESVLRGLFINTAWGANLAP